MTKEEFVERELQKRGLDVPYELLEDEYEDENENDAVPKDTDTAPKTKIGILRLQFLDDFWRYMKTENQAEADLYVNNMLKILEEVNKSSICSHICRQKGYRPDDEYDVLQEAHLSAHQMMVSDKEMNLTHPNPFARYCKPYRIHQLKYLENLGVNTRKNDKEVKHRSTNRTADIRNADSIEALAEAAGSADRLPLVSGNPFDILLNADAKQGRNILCCYLGELMNGKRKPPAPLAVMYARVLFQVENTPTAQNFDALVNAKMKEHGWKTEKSDPLYDQHQILAGREIGEVNVAASAKWAIKRMGNRVIATLKKDSEDSLNKQMTTLLAEANSPMPKEMKSALHWGDNFTTQLSMQADSLAPLTWGEVPYLKHYEEKIVHWADDTHKSVVIATARRISQDEDMMNYILSSFSRKSLITTEINKINSEKGLERE